jgi:DNA-binding NarL/FixJ family response regulator
LDGAQPLRLGTLSSSESRRLCSARLGAARVRHEPDAIDHLVELCGGLPMVLTRVAAYAAAQPKSPLWSVVCELEANVARHQPVTPRETEVARRVGHGHTNKQIAGQLAVSEWTVVNHMREIMRKLQCPSRIHVARWAWTTLDPPGAA